MCSPMVLVKWTVQEKYKNLFITTILRRFISSNLFGIGNEVEVHWGKAGYMWKMIYLEE